MCAAAVFPWTAVPSRPLPAVIDEGVRSSGSDPVTVMVTERETLTAPLEVPPNVTLWFAGGGLLRLESRLDLRGPLLAPPRPIPTPPLGGRTVCQVAKGWRVRR